MIHKLWTNKEIQFLKDNYSSLTIKECSLKLNRTYGATKSMTSILELKRPGRAIAVSALSWTGQEVQFLKDNYYELGAKKCSLKLNRTSGAIKRMASLLGLEYKLGRDFARLLVVNHRRHLDAQINATCQYCNEEFHYTKFTAKGVPRKYCSVKCYSATKHGSGNPHWKGGLQHIYEERDYLMSQKPYREWRLSVFKRDNFTCQKCNNKKDICAHHIKGWTKYPEFRYDVDNGQTLCKNCHQGSHKFNLNLYKGD
jgi:hypothetical protein